MSPLHMDEIIDLLKKIKSELEKASKKEDSLTEALRSETTKMYTRYCLELCIQKLTNTVDKNLIDKISQLRNNFKLCEENNCKLERKEELEFLSQIYKNE